MIAYVVTREHVHAETTTVYGAFASGEEAWAFVDQRSFGDEAHVYRCEGEHVIELRRP